MARLVARSTPNRCVVGSSPNNKASVSVFNKLSTDAAPVSKSQPTPFDSTSGHACAAVGGVTPPCMICVVLE